MSEDQQKPARSMEEIQQEYGKGCARAGQLQYQIVTLQKDLSLLNDTLRDLNFEAAAVQAKAKEAAAAPTPNQGA